MTYDSLERSRNDGAPIECYRFAAGSHIYLQTSADERMTVNSEVYEPYSLSRTERDQSQEDHAGPIQVTMAPLNPIAILFLPGTPETPVSLTIYGKHESDGQIVPVFSGKVVAGTHVGGNSVLRCEPTEACEKRKIPRLTYQSRCVWPLYSNPGCTVARAAFRDSILVEGVSGFTVTAAAFAARADGWFNGGYLELADGTKRWIESHVGNAVTLQQPFFGLAAGTTISAQAGCQKRELEDCHTKFNNRVNFLGWPRLPVRNPIKLGMS